MKEKNIVFTKIRSKIATSYIAWFFYRFNFVRGFILSYKMKAFLPEWSKGVDLRSTIRQYAWVRTPQNAKCFYTLTKNIIYKHLK